MMTVIDFVVKVYRISVAIFWYAMLLFLMAYVPLVLEPKPLWVIDICWFSLVIFTVVGSFHWFLNRKY